MELRYTAEAVICDLDGTLVDSAADLCAALNEILADLKLHTIKLDEVRAMIGDGVLKLIERGLAGAGGDAGQASSLVAKFLAIYEADPTRHTHCFPGVVDTLAALKSQGCRLGVVTNKPIVATEKILDSLELKKFFEIVVGGDSLPQRKPHPGPLLEAARRLKLQPSDVVMVGDNIHDVEAARGAGMRSIAVTYGYHHQPPKTFGADNLIDQFEELLPLIEIVSARNRMPIATIPLSRNSIHSVK